MGTFSTNMKATANTLLTDKGESVTFSRWATSEYNVATGGIEPTTETTFTGVGHPMEYKATEIDGTTVEANDVKLLVYTTTQPLIEDTVTVGSVNYRIMRVEELRAQGEAIVYRLQLRV